MVPEVFRRAARRGAGFFRRFWKALSRPRQPFWKRAIDVSGAIVGLAVLAPVLLLAGVAIRLVSPGPAFFRQQRVGYRGDPFTVWKFRTMKVDVDSQVHRRYVENLAETDGILKKLPADCQLIPLGALLRKLAIDELPQLINVLRGDMSLVGPRPDVVRYEKYRPQDRRRFEVLPGMTGLWQVAGKNGTTFSEMIRADLEYVDRRSLRLDVKILLTTVPAIIGRLRKGGAH
ncbi:MAG: sugar transferase [Planctomycetota bacterium]|jgi:lipopolysaccharide/colanic/teichoic acid biosynthesis glycosyltransferase